MKKIEKLTPEQIAKIPGWTKKWIDVGLSTEPADFDLATDAALRAYKLCNLENPMVVLRVGSPYAATVGAESRIKRLKSNTKQKRNRKMKTKNDKEPTRWSILGACILGAILGSMFAYASMGGF